MRRRSNSGQRALEEANCASVLRRSIGRTVTLRRSADCSHTVFHNTWRLYVRRLHPYTNKRVCSMESESKLQTMFVKIKLLLETTWNNVSMQRHGSSHCYHLQYLGAGGQCQTRLPFRLWTRTRSTRNGSSVSQKLSGKQKIFFTELGMEPWFLDYIPQGFPKNRNNSCLRWYFLIQPAFISHFFFVLSQCFVIIFCF